MLILAIWFIAFALSIKSLVTKSRRVYRARTKENSKICMTIVISILSHIGFVQLLYVDLGGWIHWLFLLLNVMFVVQMLLISNLILDNYEVFAKARVVNDKFSSFLIPFVGMSLLLYFSVYVNEALFSGLCVSIASIGVVGQLITYKNIRKFTL